MPGVGVGAGVAEGATGSRHRLQVMGHASRTMRPDRKVLQYNFWRPCATHEHPDKINNSGVCIRIRIMKRI